jgi:MFS superfamily sulfate permease-like transporter
MLWLAMTTLEKLQAVPARFWINMLLGISTFFVLLIVFRHAARMNKLLLGLLIVLLLTGVAFQWIFERNEPRFLSPYIDKIAPWFPSKIDYQQRQAR